MQTRIFKEKNNVTNVSELNKIKALILINDLVEIWSRSDSDLIKIWLSIFSLF